MTNGEFYSMSTEIYETPKVFIGQDCFTWHDGEYKGTGFYFYLTREDIDERYDEDNVTFYDSDDLIDTLLSENLIDINDVEKIRNNL